MIKDSPNGYGLLSILLHWVSALIVVGLFALGIYMVDLDYYDPWYHRAPWWHISFGLLLFLLTLARLLWRLLNPQPKPLPNYTRSVRLGSRLAKYLLYLLIFALIITGFLITTADGKSASLFGWVEFPSIWQLSSGSVDLAGEIHEWLAYGIIALASFHALAALAHHFVIRDRTLVRMLKPVKKSAEPQPDSLTQENHYE